MSETTETQPVELKLADIAACVHIIDIVTKRGAFEGSELSDVGTVRNRLAAFLEDNKSEEEDDEDAAEE